MTRGFGLGTHILQGCCQPTSKKLIPNAVDQGAGSQWIFGSCQPVGKAQAVGWPFFFPGSQFLRGFWVYLFTRHHPVAPLKDEGGTSHVVRIFDENRKAGASHLKQFIPGFFHCGEARLLFSFQAWDKGKPNDGGGILLSRSPCILGFEVQIDFTLQGLERDFPDHIPLGFVDHKAG